MMDSTYLMHYFNDEAYLYSFRTMDDRNDFVLLLKDIPEDSNGMCRKYTNTSHYCAGHVGNLHDVNEEIFGRFYSMIEFF
jgi:hypothetical protein